MTEQPATILVAEDDPEMLRAVRRALELAGYHVLVAQDGATALALASEEALALLVLDIGLPRLDGLTACRRVREFSDMPIIMITARGQDEDVVRGLDAGADDYLPKPFSIDQLLARVRARLRRTRPTADKPRAAYTHGALVVDFAWRRASVGGREIRLSPTEYRLLATLAAYPGLVLTKHQLLESVWGAESAHDRHLLQVNMTRLRRKLEPDPDHPRYIITTPGVGYGVPKPE
jgi:DNA-binding response OmpR family regulator